MEAPEKRKSAANGIPSVSVTSPSNDPGMLYSPTTSNCCLVFSNLDDQNPGSVSKRVSGSGKYKAETSGKAPRSSHLLLSKAMANGSINPRSLISDDTTTARKAKLAEFENNTIVKQRHELNLMIEELKDRDLELNHMVEAHQKQLLSWEKDRRTILALDEKVAGLERDIQSKNDDIRAVTSKLRVTQSELAQRTTALSNAQEQLGNLSEQQSTHLLRMEELHKQLDDFSEQATYLQMEIKDLEERNQHLCGTVRDLNSQIGQLEAREQELLTVLKLKDKDLSESSKHMAELTAKLKRVEVQYENCRRNDSEARRSASDWKNKYNQCWKEYEHFKHEAQKSDKLVGEQKAELLKLKQECAALRKELTLSTEREKRTEQLLEMQKNKQERSDRELQSVRDLYAQQERDLALLQLNLDGTKEVMQKQQERYLAKGLQLRPAGSQRSISPSKTPSFNTMPADLSFQRSRSPTRRSVEVDYRRTRSPDQRLKGSSPSRLAEYSYSPAKIRARSPGYVRSPERLTSTSPTRLRSPERSLRMTYTPEPKFELYNSDASLTKKSSGFYEDSYSSFYKSSSPGKTDCYQTPSWSSTKELTSAADILVEKYYPRNEITAKDTGAAQNESKLDQISSDISPTNERNEREVQESRSGQSTPIRGSAAGSVHSELSVPKISSDSVENKQESPIRSRAESVKSEKSVASETGSVRSLRSGSIPSCQSAQSGTAQSVHSCQSVRSGSAQSVHSIHSNRESQEATPRAANQQPESISRDHTLTLTHDDQASAQSTPRSGPQENGGEQSPSKEATGHAQSISQSQSTPQSGQSSDSGTLDEQELLDMFAQVNSKIAVKKSVSDDPRGLLNGEADPVNGLADGLSEGVDGQNEGVDGQKEERQTDRTSDAGSVKVSQSGENEAGELFDAVD